MISWIAVIGEIAGTIVTAVTIRRRANTMGNWKHQRRVGDANERKEEGDGLWRGSEDHGLMQSTGKVVKVRGNGKWNKDRE